MRFIIIVRGTRGYGVDYGVIDPFPYNEIVSSLDRLGENILYALKNFSTQWEDSILSVKIKGDFSLIAKVAFLFISDTHVYY